jgi:hypothetical protein
VFRSLQIIVVMIACILPSDAFGQTVSSRGGNVFLKAEDGRIIQITSSGLDLEPSLSMDKKHVIFVRRTPSSRISTGTGSEQVRFLCRGIGLEVLNSGYWAGHLIVLKDIARVLPGHICRYWLLDQDGKDVGEIGEKESDVRAFKSGRF